MKKDIQRKRNNPPMRDEFKKLVVYGTYKFQNFDKDDNLVEESDWMPNQVVNTYAYVLADLFLKKDSFSNATPIMCIGTGTAAVTTADTRLGVEAYRVSTTVSASTFEASTGMITDGTNINAIDITGTFAANAGIALTITEIGITWGYNAAVATLNSGKLFSRRVISGGWAKAADLKSVFVYRLIFKEV